MLFAKKEKKAFKLLEVCKRHGGPITPNTLNDLDRLGKQEILNEVTYLRATVAPNIREKYKLLSGKFQKLSIDKLKAQICNVLCPTSKCVNNLDDLLLNLEVCIKIFYFYLKLVLFIFNFCKKLKNVFQ